MFVDLYGIKDIQERPYYLETKEQVERKNRIIKQYVYIINTTKFYSSFQLLKYIQESSIESWVNFFSNLLNQENTRSKKLFQFI